jgi:hypothetical protein
MEIDPEEPRSDDLAIEAETAERQPRGRSPSLQMSRLVAILLVGITFASIVFILYRDRARLISFDWQIDVGFLLLTGVLYSITMGLLFATWHSIFKQTSGFTDLRADFRIYYLSLLARRFAEHDLVRGRPGVYV